MPSDEESVAGTLPARLARGDALATCWLTIADPFLAELLARRGFDALVVDMQHGLPSRATLLPLLQAAELGGALTLVRVPPADPAAVTLALDLGADGVIVPLIDSAADAAEMVAAMRYPPEGARSYGPLRAALRLPDYAARVAEHAALFAMIETRAGFDDLDAICAVPGLAGVFVGPADLGYALGVGPQTDGDHPVYRAALARIFAACERHQLACGLHSDDPAVGRAFAAAAPAGSLVVVATDTKLLGSGADARLAAWRDTSG